MLVLYAHPFSGYCWKVLIALWENHLAFDYRRVDKPAHAQAWQHAGPFAKMPLAIDGAAVIPEATIIIEYLQRNYPGPALMIPNDPAVALEVRKLDRIADNYLTTPMQILVGDHIRAPADRDPTGTANAHALLETAYAWWNAYMTGRGWAGESFSLADCAAAPALFYADWVHPIGKSFPALRDYRARLLARPSVARAVEEARPFRPFFPPGAPERDEAARD